MKTPTRWFCHVVIQLDRIPRYGRLYRMDRTDEGWYTVRHPYWKWQKRGRWGLNLLDRMGLMWPYLDELMGPYDKEDDDAVA